MNKKLFSDNFLLIYFRKTQLFKTHYFTKKKKCFFDGLFNGNIKSQN